METTSETTQMLQLLLQRAGEGDAGAYNQLLERASARLLKMAQLMLRNYPHLRRWEQTDDVFQNAMIRLHRSLAEVRPPTVPAFFGLAATQIRRTLIDLIRHHFGPEGDAAHHESDVASTPSGGALQTVPDRGGRPETLESWARFHEAVQGLPDDAREVFDLVWYAGMEQREAAELLSVSLSTVQRRWHQARALLYDALQGESPLLQERGPP
jgi:RNA polymerase sigma factor (sigma-70 family)